MLDRPKATLFEQEAVLLLWATLVTGREARQLIALKLVVVPKGVALSRQPPGLIKRDGVWGWWLRAGKPRTQKPPPAVMQANLLPWSENLYLPATDLTVRVIERCMRLRARQSSGRTHIAGQAEPLFASGKPLLAAVTRLLADRQEIGQARRATTTPEALSRWLPAAMIQALGGDVVPASVVSARVDAIGRTPIYYGAVRLDAVARRYRHSIRTIDRPAHNDIPGQLAGLVAGDRRTPTDDAVRALVQRLANDLRDADDLAQRHAAMTRYTVALLGFALAHRGDSGNLPAFDDIDAETRFVWIEDKRVAEQPSRRLVWVCEAARDQLRRFEAHLDYVEAAVSPAAAAGIRARRATPGLALFDMEHGPIRRLSVPDAMGDAIGRAGPLPKNAGRHWLRAQLVGKCSTETLHALFGHGPVDDGSWDRSAGLDPFVYRADLARMLDPMLASIGWVPRGPVS